MRSTRQREILRVRHMKARRHMNLGFTKDVLTPRSYHGLWHHFRSRVRPSERSNDRNLPD